MSFLLASLCETDTRQVALAGFGVCLAEDNVWTVVPNQSFC